MLFAFILYHVFAKTHHFFKKYSVFPMVILRSYAKAKSDYIGIRGG